MITEQTGSLRCSFTGTVVPLKSGYLSVSDLLKAIKTGHEDDPVQKVKVPQNPGDAGTGSKRGI
jgi:hypothetical protein